MAESRVELALPKNFWRPVHVLELVRLREAITAPVVGDMVRVLSEFDTEFTPPTQEPLIAKQPPKRLKPFEAVEVAPVPVRLR